MEKYFKGIVSGTGKPLIYGGFSEFFRENKNKEFILSVEFPEKGNEIPMIRYFRAVIITEFMKVFREHYGEHTLPELVEHRLLSWFPDGSKNGTVRELESFSKTEFIALIEHCKYIAGKEFDHFIE